VRGVVDTLVVGGGLSGLAYAQARGPQADVLVLEAGDRPGGLMRTTRTPIDGGGAVQFEWGPETLPGASAQSGELRALLAELKLEALAAPESAARQLVAQRGLLRTLPRGLGALLASRLLGPGGKLRLLSEPWRETRAALDGSVADFLRHRLGDEAWGRIAEPLVTAQFGSDPEGLALRSAYPELRARVLEHGSLWKAARAARRALQRDVASSGEAPSADQVPSGGKAPNQGTAPTPGSKPGSTPPSHAEHLTLPGGLGKLADALAKSLGNRLLLNVRVLSLAQEGATFDDPWEAVADLTRHPMIWRIDAQTFHGPSPEALSWRARRLVLALPARPASRLLLPVDRTLGEELASISSESVVSLSHAWRRQDVGHALDAFGLLVPASESRVHLGTVFSSTIRPGCCTEGLVLLRTLLGGGRNTRLIDWPEEELWGAVAQEVVPLLRLKGEPVWRSVIRQREALPRYDLEHPRRAEHIEHMVDAVPGLSMLGSWGGGTGCDRLVAAARALAREHAQNEGQDGRGGRGARSHPLRSP
jgi:protoporphyrinogen/coproporphyrinogen III oxidase